MISNGFMRRRALIGQILGPEYEILNKFKYLNPKLSFVIARGKFLLCHCEAHGAEAIPFASVFARDKVPKQSRWGGVTTMRLPRFARNDREMRFTMTLYNICFTLM